VGSEFNKAILEDIDNISIVLFENPKWQKNIYND
jgi:hypothetical protein